MKIVNIECYERELKNFGFKFDENDGKYKIEMKNLYCEINSWNGLIRISLAGNKDFNNQFFTQEVIKLSKCFINNFMMLEEDFKDEK